MSSMARNLWSFVFPIGKTSPKSRRRTRLFSCLKLVPLAEEMDRRMHWQRMDSSINEMKAEIREIKTDLSEIKSNKQK